LRDLLPGVLLFGVGLAATVAPLTTTVLGAVDERRAGVASGVNNAIARVAALLAIAALGAVVGARYTAELDARRLAAEEELARLGDARERIEYLEALPRMVEAYLCDLPEIVRGAGLGEPRDYETTPEPRTEDNPLGAYTLMPDRIRERTNVEMEEIRRERQREHAERLRALYEVLGLSVVAHRDGTLDVSWGTGDGLGRCKLVGSGP
jgi:hypothetical protein